MGKDNRICYTCGKAYHYCFSCPDDPRPRWTFMFCCERCKDVFTILTDFEAGHITAEEANQKLVQYEITKEEIATYPDSIRYSFSKLNEGLKPVKHKYAKK